MRRDYCFKKLILESQVIYRLSFKVSVDRCTRRRGAKIRHGNWTVKSTQQWAKGILLQNGLQEAALESEILIRSIADIDRVTFYAKPEHPITQTQCRILDEMLERRIAKEPLPYILGQREFFGLPFKITPDVLIPRPETEILVEEALSWINSHRTNEKRMVIADIGTGSGCIAVSLATQLGIDRFFATDISREALQIAKSNAVFHGVGEKIEFLHGDLLDPVPNLINLLIGNLPYITDEEFARLPTEIQSYEPSQALRGGADGTKLIKQLLEQAPNYLTDPGAIILEISPQQLNSITTSSQKFFPASQARVVKDLAGLDRVFIVDHFPERIA